MWTWRRRADEHLRNLPIDGVGRGLPRVSGNPKRHGQLPPAPGFLSLRRQLHDDAGRVRRHRQVDDVDDALFTRPRGLGRGVVRRQVAHLTARSVEERFPFRRATRTLRGGVVVAERGQGGAGSGGAQQALEPALGVRLPERGPDVFADAIVGGKGAGAAHGEQIGLGVQLDDESRGIADERSQPGGAGAGDANVARGEVSLTAGADIGGEGGGNAAGDHPEKYRAEGGFGWRLRLWLAASALAGGFG